MNVLDYLNVCDSYSKQVVIVFGKPLGGGIGDLTKFFTYLLQLCIVHKVRLYYLLTGHPIDKYIKLDARFYISEIKHSLSLYSINELPDIIDNVLYVVHPSLMYNVENLYDKLVLPLHEIFSFSHEVLKRAEPYLNDYISVHLRLGDKHLETDKQYVMVQNDERVYNELKLFSFLEKQNVFFFCDNKSYKQRVKRMFDHTKITDFDIGHSSFLNTTDSQIIDGLAEFYLLSKSKHIYKASYSGFSIMASKMYDCTISDL